MDTKGHNSSKILITILQVELQSKSLLCDWGIRVEVNCYSKFKILLLNSIAQEIKFGETLLRIHISYISDRIFFRASLVRF